ncbi:LapA family protein [Rhodothermus profundi]|uniref:Putative membrane protein n=1 Tax=Rhodothermus profundi TaxID=633813 RepID=A0A1M6PEP0_9BACT|nr:LapA family protein [Rhodothermus profundi]SHK06413.1 putative membrane protein [Rhodothermus profundi]
MRTSFLILSLLLAILAVMFALQNPGYVTLRFGPYQTEQSTALVVLVSFALGVLVGILASVPGRLRSAREIRQLRKQLSQSSSEATSSSSLDSITESPYE